MRAVVRHLNAAWLEYQHHGDGAVFMQAASARLGFKNALATLPRGPRGRSTRRASNLPDLKIRVREHTQGGSTFRGLMAQPGQAHKDALEKWVCSPAVEGDELVDDPNASDPIDWLAVSGHGTAGRVFGTGSGKYADIEMINAFIGGAGKPRSGRLKCIIVPACNNMNEHIAHAWFPAFNHEKPVYLILGYASRYKGHSVGARVMGRFVAKIAKDRTIPIIEAWAEANRASREPWAALVAKGAESMNVADWVAGNLPELSNVSELLYFNDDAPGGITPQMESDVWRLRWVMHDGTELESSNNGIRRTQNGLFAGRPGKIRIKSLHPTADFKQGHQLFLRIYLHRPDKSLDLDKLLEIDSSLLIPHPTNAQPLVIPEKGTSGRPDDVNHVDGFRIAVPADTDTVEIGFQIRQDAIKAFPAEGSGAHGLFILEFAPHGGWTQHSNGFVDMLTKVYGATTGALLRP
jgi:hypothetical protein